MKLMQRLIYSGFAAVALASAAMPVFPAPLTTLAPDSVIRGVDFEWYANVGRDEPVVVVMPKREGYIWSPSHWEWNGSRHVWVEGHWVRDDFAEQVAMHNLDAGTPMAEAPLPPRTVYIERR